MNHIEVKSIYDKQGTNFTGSVIDDDGDIAYYVNGKFHRVNEPAIEWSDGSKHWYVNGRSHRLDGPAIKDIDGYNLWSYYNNVMSNDPSSYHDYFTSDDPNYTLEDFHRALKAESFEI